MQKNWLLSFALILVAFNCFAQNNNGIIVFSVGPSFPVGKYGSKNSMNNSAGLAKPGETASISYYSKKKKQFGYIVALQAQRNPLNTNELETTFSQAKFERFTIFTLSGNNPQPPPPSYTMYPNWKFDKHVWAAGSLLAGCYAEFASHNSSLSFISKAMIGAVYASSPKLNGKSITDTATAHFEQNSRSGIGFIYLLSSGLKYHISKKLSLYSHLEYAETNSIKFKKIKTVLFTTHGSPNDQANFSTSQSSVTMDGKQKIASINFSIGIGLRL